MSVHLQIPTYKRLVKDITALYDHARNTVVETYWKIGKRIAEEVNYFGVLEYSFKIRESVLSKNVLVW